MLPPARACSQHCWQAALLGRRGGGVTVTCKHSTPMYAPVHAPWPPGDAAALRAGQTKAVWLASNEQAVAPRWRHPVCSAHPWSQQHGGAASGCMVTKRDQGTCVAQPCAHKAAGPQGAQQGQGPALNSGHLTPQGSLLLPPKNGSTSGSANKSKQQCCPHPTVSSPHPNSVVAPPLDSRSACQPDPACLPLQRRRACAHGQCSMHPCTWGGVLGNAPARKAWACRPQHTRPPNPSCTLKCTAGRSAAAAAGSPLDAEAEPWRRTYCTSRQAPAAQSVASGAALAVSADASLAPLPHHSSLARQFLTPSSTTGE